MAQPPMTVLLPVRDGLGSLRPVLEALRGQARATGTEVLIVGAVGDGAPAGTRTVHVDSADIYRLRMIGVREARGAIVAIGEDHAVPRPDWCAATIRAHAERPDAPAVCGCLVNATDRTLGGRANFLSFSAPFQAPMPELPSSRPPPSSTLSIKRAALAEIAERSGWLEVELVPRWFAAGQIVADDRIVIDHHQDERLGWAVANAFHASRASYGIAGQQLGRQARAAQARWAVRRWPARVLRETRAAVRGHGVPGWFDLAAVVPIAVAVGVGAAAGSLAGPGRSPERVA